MTTKVEEANTPVKVAEKKKVKRRNRIYRYPADIGSDEQPHAINFYIFQTETASEREARNQDLTARALFTEENTDEET